MKKADIQVGGDYALVEGEGHNDKHPRKAIRVHVLEVGVRRQWSPNLDGVLVRVVPDDLNQIESPGRINRTDRHDDGTLVVGTRRLWLPWTEAVPQIEEHVAKIKLRQVEIDVRSKRIEALAAELRRREYVNSRVSWPYEGEPRVTIDVDVLEDILGLKEHP